MSLRHLRVSPTRQTAEVWDGERLLQTFKISTAKNGLGVEEGSFRTPTGMLRVARKIGADLPLGTVFKARIPTNEVWSSSLAPTTEDLILTRILWLEGLEPTNANTFKRYIYLHGTNQEHLLGQPASHGCIRFSNRDIVEVFELLTEGSEVRIDEV